MWLENAIYIIGLIIQNHVWEKRWRCSNSFLSYWGCEFAIHLELTVHSFITSSFTYSEWNYVYCLLWCSTMEYYRLLGGVFFFITLLYGCCFEVVKVSWAIVFLIKHNPVLTCVHLPCCSANSSVVIHVRSTETKLNSSGLWSQTSSMSKGFLGKHQRYVLRKKFMQQSVFYIEISAKVTGRS